MPSLLARLFYEEQDGYKVEDEISNRRPDQIFAKIVPHLCIDYEVIYKEQ